jgi:hypothetical protein
LLLFVSWREASLETPKTSIGAFSTKRESCIPSIIHHVHFLAYAENGLPLHTVRFRFGRGSHSMNHKVGRITMYDRIYRAPSVVITLSGRNFKDTDIPIEMNVWLPIRPLSQRKGTPLPVGFCIGRGVPRLKPAPSYMTCRQARSPSRVHR